jgi:rRNA-processing protein FCF1
MIEEYNKKFEEDCVKNNYTVFYYKFSQIIKECRIRELEKLKENIRINPSFKIKP